MKGGGNVQPDPRRTRGESNNKDRANFKKADEEQREANIRARRQSEQRYNKTIADLESREALSEEQQKSLDDARYELVQIAKYFVMAEEEFKLTRELQEQAEKKEQAHRALEEHARIHEEIAATARAAVQQYSLLELKQKQCALPYPDLLALLLHAPYSRSYECAGCRLREEMAYEQQKQIELDNFEQQKMIDMKIHKIKAQNAQKARRRDELMQLEALKLADLEAEVSALACNPLGMFSCCRAKSLDLASTVMCFDRKSTRSCWKP